MQLRYAVSLALKEEDKDAVMKLKSRGVTNIEIFRAGLKKLIKEKFNGNNI